jgi:hypothetical protein
MGFDQSLGVPSGFSLSFSRVLGPQKLYLRKLGERRSNFIVADETVHDRIVEPGVFSKQVNNASQVETSKHATETTVEVAIIADDTLQLLRVKHPIDAMLIHVFLEYAEGFASERIEKFSAASGIDVNCHRVLSGLGSRAGVAD